MKFYSFSGVNNPFHVRQEFYDKIRLFEQEIGKSISEVQTDLIAISLYKNSFGLITRNSNREVLAFFQEVNSAAGIEFGNITELALMAICYDDYKANPLFELNFDNRLIEECINEENLQALEELNAVLEEDKLINNSYKIARYLSLYKQSTGEIPEDMNEFMRRYVYTCEQKEEVVEEEINAQVWLC